MRTLAIGDIHGCFRALTTLADYIKLSPIDRVIALGDYVDRGPDSRSVLDWLIARYDKGNLVPLLGNHELMMLAARRDGSHLAEWLQCGGDATLRSYGKDASLDAVPDSHWAFFNSCRAYYQSQEHFFVHANAYPDLALEEQPKYMLHWEFFDAPAPHESGKIMVCGHTPQKGGDPLSLDHAICIDTWACSGGWLTCLEPSSGRYWQANEQGEARQSWL